ncbi:MAG: PQQ-binding-like beta-propeller repeat protein [Opitutales bacterium]|nr:PQQ-binding-like beta-propeller repeat protein [Opitutales bacterium]MBT5813547.1 PQQ-binding-like beta-propeller repeat protein [Opitutales bacterium]
MKAAYTGLIGILTASFIHADVHSWRNGGNGTYPKANAMFDWTDPSSLRWKIETPAKSNASPILVRGKLFYCIEPATLVCASADTGEILWQTSYGYETLLANSPSEKKKIKEAKSESIRIEEELAPLKREQYKLARLLSQDKTNKLTESKLASINADIQALENQIPEILKALQKPETKEINGYASYTPCSDGESVYTCTGLGIVAKFSLNGERLWSKRMEWPDHPWGGASSPVLAGKKLIVRFADYVALDTETGREIWRTPDPVAFGTPSLFQLEDQWFLYTIRGELIRVADGKKLPSQDWTIEGKEHAFFNTNAISGNRIYAVHGASQLDGQAYCLEIPDTIPQLESSGLTLIWNASVDQDRYYTSPLIHDGLIYLLSRNGIMQVLNDRSGKLNYSQKIPRLKDQCYAGLLLVGDKIYLGEENGNVIILETGNEYREAKRFNIGECRSSPIFDGNTAYLRTLDALFAFRSQ